MASVHEVMDMNSRSVLKRGKAMPAKMRSMEIEPAESGHIVTHRMESDGAYREPEKHVFGKGEGKELLAHIAEHMGIKTEKPGEGEDAEVDEDKDSAAGAAT